MGRLDGKTAFVTAAAAGIGRASALAMAREGARVTASDIDADMLATLADEARGLPGTLGTRVLNVRDPSAIRDAVGEAGAPDVLFNCVGHVANGTILECDEHQWAFSLDLNMTAMYRMMRAFLPPMLARGHGNIINMASVASSVVAAPDRFAYGATKAGVIGMTKAVAADFVTRGIRCNAICPGTVETPSLQARLRETGDEAQARRAFVARQPMGRLGRADEIAALAVYLASDESAFTTGQIHIIDGGWANV